VQPVDQRALHELDLYAENESGLYPQKQAIIANLQKKKAKGVYDPEKAAKLWAYWVDRAAKQYKEEFKGSDFQWTFGRSTKNALAAELAKRYEDGEG
jgi:hypothetical protein